MSTLTRPLDDLREAVAQGGTGEFICATSALEVHVYVQQGRVAWATVSSHPFQFARHIMQHSRIDDATFKQVLEECRREKLPLGETLVEWGLVTWDTVRAALRHQVQLAIAALAELGAGRTMFLERKRFTEYNPELTIDLRDLVAELRAAGAPTSPAVAATDNGGARFAQQLYESIEGATWVELLEEGELVDRAPAAAGGSEVPAALAAVTLDDDADFVAVRSARGSIIGLNLSSPRRSLWCALAADSTFGAAVSTLWTLTAIGPSGDTAAIEPPAPSGGDWQIGDRQCSASKEIREFLDRAREVMAVVVLAAGCDPLVGVARGGLDAESCLTLLRRRARALTVDVFPDGDAGEQTLVTGERRLWCFGSELFGEPQQTLWVLTERKSSQGLGWACLAALGRVLPQSLRPDARHA